MKADQMPSQDNVTDAVLQPQAWMVIRRNFSGAGRMVLGVFLDEQDARYYAKDQIGADCQICLETAPLEPRT